MDTRQSSRNRLIRLPTKKRLDCSAYVITRCGVCYLMRPMATGHQPQLLRHMWLYLGRVWRNDLIAPFSTSTTIAASLISNSKSTSFKIFVPLFQRHALLPRVYRLSFSSLLPSSLLVAIRRKNSDLWSSHVRAICHRLRLQASNLSLPLRKILSRFPRVKNLFLMIIVLGLVASPFCPALTRYLLLHAKCLFI